MRVSGRFSSNVVYMGPPPPSPRWILQQFGVASRQNRRARVRIFIDRKRLFATSVEQLGRMGPAHLAEPPFVVFGGSAEDPAREDGVDFGGLRREWLGQLAGEFRLPERGLLEAPRACVGDSVTWRGAIAICALDARSTPSRPRFDRAT